MRERKRKIVRTESDNRPMKHTRYTPAEETPKKPRPTTTGTVVNSNPHRLHGAPRKTETAIHGEGARYAVENLRENTKPKYPGMFVGHTVYFRRNRETGTLCAFQTESGEFARFKARRAEYDSAWMWNGKEWQRDHRVNVG